MSATDQNSPEAIRALVKTIDHRSNSSEWLKTLDDRKMKEAEFHDRKHIELKKAETDKAVDTYEAIYTNRKYYRAVNRCAEYSKNWIRNEANGNVFLDYCCGIGGSAVSAAQGGAALSIGVDVSAFSLEVAEQRARDASVTDNCIFYQGDAENTGLPDNSIDRVICSGVLHHLDISYAFPELRRILKPGGRILAVEALDYNPAIKLYRTITPSIRTEWEKAHILSMKDVRFAERFFDVENVNFWHVTAIAAPHLPGFMGPILNGLDTFVEKIPGLRLMAWMFTFEMVKPIN